MSHSLSVPNTGDRVWVLCHTPAIPCPLGALCPLAILHPWSPCTPNHLCPLALFCAAPGDPTGTSCCQGRNGTSGTASLGPELIAIVPGFTWASTATGHSTGWKCCHPALSLPWGWPHTVHKAS